MSTATTASKPLLRGVVFDMDGTLTVPVIDFAAMYKSVLGEDQYTRVKAENPTGIDILHHIENWSPDKQRQAYQIIADFERQGLDRLQIMPGLPTFLFFLISLLSLLLIFWVYCASECVWLLRIGGKCGKQKQKRINSSEF